MLFIYLYHADPYSDLWKSDLYFRPIVFKVYGPCINIRGTCSLLPDLCLHQSCCLWTLVALQVALLQEAEWHEEDSCSLDSTHGEIEIWIVTWTKKIYHDSFLSSDLEMALKNDYNYTQIDRTSVIYKCTKFLHSKCNMHYKTCKSWIVKIKWSVSSENLNRFFSQKTYNNVMSLTTQPKHDKGDN